MTLVLLGAAVIVLPWDRVTARLSPRVRARDTALFVRPAGRADAAGVVGLIGRVYAEYGFVYAPEVEVPDLFRFDEHYSAPRGAFFVVLERNAVVGSVGVERVDDDTALSRLSSAWPRDGTGAGRGGPGLVSRSED